MIAPEARTLLAQKFTERGWPWFANDAMNESHHQWDAPLEVISELLPKEQTVWPWIEIALENGEFVTRTSHPDNIEEAGE